jgi:hypothetical protein
MIGVPTADMMSDVYVVFNYAVQVYLHKMVQTDQVICNPVNSDLLCTYNIAANLRVTIV